MCLRLSTRPLPQPVRSMTASLREDIIKGGFWCSGGCEPSEADVVIAFCGVIAHEAFAAAEVLREGGRKVAVLQVTSPERLVNGGERHAEMLLDDLGRETPILTVIDAHPASLSWIGGVRGNRVRSLGVDTFGQSGDIIDLYRHHEIDAEAIVEAANEMIDH